MRWPMTAFSIGATRVLNVEISLFIFVDCLSVDELALMMFSANAAGRTMSRVFGSRAGRGWFEKPQ